MSYRYEVVRNDRTRQFDLVRYDVDQRGRINPSGVVVSSHATRAEAEEATDYDVV